MKVRYEQLTEDYNELKSAVEKLISKGELQRKTTGLNPGRVEDRYRLKI